VSQSATESCLAGKPNSAEWRNPGGTGTTKRLGTVKSPISVPDSGQARKLLSQRDLTASSFVAFVCCHKTLKKNHSFSLPFAGAVQTPPLFRSLHKELVPEFLAPSTYSLGSSFPSTHKFSSLGS